MNISTETREQIIKEHLSARAKKARDTLTKRYGVSYFSKLGKTVAQNLRKAPLDFSTGVISAKRLTALYYVVSCTEMDRGGRCKPVGGQQGATLNKSSSCEA
jgi:hypothetical protein